MPELPAHARAVVIGGGVSGCSAAYHLAKLGWDVVLLERRKLTSGTTWHAAGLVGQLRGSRNMTRLAKYSADLYARLEEETGVATGLRRCGSLSVALTPDRQHELLRQATLARAFGVEVHEQSPSELKGLYPHLEIGDVVGGVHLPGDGQCDPANIAMALAKGARMHGAKVVEGVKVTGITQAEGRVTGVDWEGLDGSRGKIVCEAVVNCGGMWGRDLAARSGVTLPLHAAEHFYVVSEPIPGLDRLPVLRVPDECAYYKEDAGKIMVGAFEPVAKPWGMDGIPETFEFDELPFDMEHMEPVLEKAMARIPMLAGTGFRTLFNGPESFTPDDRYYLGEAPELQSYWIAAGYNSIGIVSSGGAGMALAQWMEDGEPPFDLWEVDIRRAQPFQRNRRYLKERVSETLGLLYADHYPYRQVVTARGVRKSPVHDRLVARGAVFGEVAGWERANWFAKPGQEREYRYAWGKQNWWANQREEHLAVRQRVGLFDMTSFGKIRVEGRDACVLLQGLCANDVDVPAGRIVYTQMLNGRGGIEADITVTRLSETAFLIVTAGAHLQRDLAWLRRHLGDAFAVVTDVSSAEACFVVMGPESRNLLAQVTPDDLSNAAFPYGTAREIELGLGLARAHRVSYVGELGWELYVPMDQAQHTFDTLTEAGGEALKLCGLHALDSCRLEKAFRHWGHDITDEDHVLEAGLGFAVKTDKGDFLGRDAVLRKHNEGLVRRLVQFRLEDPEPILFHNEGIVRDGEIVGILTSGAYGHALGGAVGLGYVPCAGETPAQLLASRYEIEIAGTRVAAQASLKPMYDPKSERVRL
jgi:4-methylaminobutanoate oxidase (formaldehyde-forming)